ncbi:hypothetical protein HJC23_003504 [Cyclotella cryptica]|uniref:Uncharacterized protein n=1 Tax=Cyclotella cryptica TaxID=29204 RepID=A0ABD3P9Q2_9STRA
MQEAISSAQRRGDEARAQVAATLGVYEPHPRSSRRQRSTRYGAAAAELFEREFGGGGMVALMLVVTQAMKIIGKIMEVEVLES